MTLKEWLRCHLGGQCVQMSAAQRRRLEELKARTRRAERQAEAFRWARESGRMPSWESLYREGESEDGR